jgi:uncharacterized protein YkwD
MFPSRRPKLKIRLTTRLTVCAILAISLTIIPLPTFSLNAIAGLNITVDSSVDELTVLDSLNKARVKNGMASLKSDPRLSLMARDYGQEMISKNFFGHVSPVSGDVYNRFTKANIRKDGLFAGENLAMAPSVEIAHNNLMESPKHKANILEPRYTHVGIGVIDGPNGKVIVQEFSTYPQEMQPVAVLQTANELLIIAAGWIASVVPISI